MEWTPNTLQRPLYCYTKGTFSKSIFHRPKLLISSRTCLKKSFPKHFSAIGDFQTTRYLVSGLSYAEALWILQEKQLHKPQITITVYKRSLRKASAPSLQNSTLNFPLQKTIEEHCSQACSVCFPIQLRTACLRVAPPPVGLGPPTSITNQENAPRGLPTGQADGGNSSTDVLPSQTTLSLYQVDRK